MKFLLLLAIIFLSSCGLKKNLELPQEESVAFAIPASLAIEAQARIQQSKQSLNPLTSLVSRNFKSICVSMNPAPLVRDDSVW